MGDPVQIPISQDDADDAARIIANILEPRMQERLISWIEDGTLPDLGIMKLREMSRSLAQGAVQPSFETISLLGHPERCPVVNKGRRRKANV
tara:strand:- start:2510 stop:2785 length:276 start_codon:yes stop_codon:yes gene_type:complete